MKIYRAGAESSEGIQNLLDLKDVDITGLRDNVVLKYDSASGKFVVADYNSGGSGEVITGGVVPFRSDIKYPEPIEFDGGTHNVSDETELLSAISTASDGDIVNLTSNITLTSTLNINKKLKIDSEIGAVLQSAGGSTDPVRLIDITSDNVYITDKIAIKHKKTSNTTVEAAVYVNAQDFVSKANIEFMETGYLVRGSFSISGTTTYTGSLGNSHRHVFIYRLDKPSQLNKVRFDSPEEATPRSNFVFHTYAVSGDGLFATIKVANCHQMDITKRIRQFFFMEYINTSVLEKGLIFENNAWNDLNGGIGLLTSVSEPLGYFDFICIMNNFQGEAGASSYKGVFFIDGSGGLKSLGSTMLYYVDNTHLSSLRSDYTSAIDNGGVAYKNTVFENDAPLVIQERIFEENNIYNYIKNFLTKRSVLDGGGF